MSIEPIKREHIVWNGSGQVIPTPANMTALFNKLQEIIVDLNILTNFHWGDTYQLPEPEVEDFQPEPEEPQPQLDYCVDCGTREGPFYGTGQRTTCSNCLPF